MPPNSWKRPMGNNLEVETAVLTGFKAKGWEAALRLISYVKFFFNKVFSLAVIKFCK